MWAAINTMQVAAPTEKMVIATATVPRLSICTNAIVNKMRIASTKTAVHLIQLMLDWLKETEMATRLETAIARVIAEGKVRTYDMGGKHSTLDVAKAIADYAS